MKHDKHKDHKQAKHEPETGEDVDVVVDGNLAELQKKAQDYEELWDKHLRICAEFDNTRKRWEREKQEIYKIGNFNLIGDVVIVLDEMEHALRSAREHGNDPQIVKGIEMMYEKLKNLLQKHGLKAMEAKGKKFDPHLHEIVGQQASDEYEEHVVIEEVQKGYFLEDKVLRTAKVILAVSPAEANGG